MLKRVITGLVLIACGNFVIIFGGWYLVAWTLGFSLVSAYELFQLYRLKQKPVFPALGYVFIAGIALLGSPWAQSISVNLMPYQFALHGLTGLIIVISFWEIVIKKPLVVDNGLYLTSKVVLLIGATMAHALLLRAQPLGGFLLYFAVLMVSIGDTSALFVGKAIGKHPLSSISPKKTVEGFFGHMFFDVLIAAFFVWVCLNFFNVEFSLFRLLIFAVVLSLVSQLGDIHESLNKRYFNVKDSSGLLPGHGGFYDRIDGFLFAMPVAYFLFVFC